MLHDKTEQPKRKRKGAPKSKTGCLTCKIRRLKCDETRPSCNRCRSTDRLCDFMNPQEKSRAQLSKPTPLHVSVKAVSLRSSCSLVLLPKPTYPPTMNLSAHEGEHLEYFRLMCTRSFSKVFANTLWDRTILQIANSEPSIRSGIVALAILLRFLMGHHTASSTAIISQSSLFHSEAVTSLNHRLDSSERSWELALTASLLFAVFEIFRDDDILSLKHFEAGLAMLEHYRMKAHRDSHVYKQLCSTFSRFDTQASAFAVFYHKKYLESASVSVPSKFETINEARAVLDNILACMQRFIKPRIGRHRTLPYVAIPTICSTRLKDIESLFDKWSSAFDSSLRLFTTNDSAIQILRLQHLAATITTSTVFYRDELAYDAFSAQFKEIIRLAEIVIQASMKSEVDLTFSFDMGIIMPVYLVACKCRDPVLRRRAIYLLNQSGYEGMWHGQTMAAAARWAMNLEETRGPGHGSEPFVPEERRLREIAVSINRYSKEVRPVSSTRSSDGLFHYHSARIRWGEKMTTLAEYPSKTTKEDRICELWAAHWRSHVEIIPVYSEE